MNPDLPLQGKTVLITRQQNQSAQMSERIKQYGGQPIVMPVLTFKKRQLDKQEQPRLHDAYDWIVFTSTNSVRFFFEHIHVQDLKQVKIAAVGSKTSAAIRAYGLTPDFIPDQYDAVSLGAYFARLTTYCRVLLPQGNLARTTLKESLMKAGHHVRSIVLYDTVMNEESDAQIEAYLRDGQVDVVTFASPSAVHFFTHLLGPDLALVQGQAVIACIGKTTYAAAQEDGLTPSILPETFTAEAMIDAIAAYYKEVCNYGKYV
ncbi:uroporphyrinogen-III synthase [Tuberibacillus sp. Marseille-P3662]|uniref:uroporphyrinogen-III synthase n=1 Tax=Tuberibacillus sp. Marseille-P3662 TaxID=1965358 RepID=UPI000A1CF22B|nr:uroporphyrinogen-III synthase [Tuberibacillus sp. Marseille-P3662]